MKKTRRLSYLSALIAVTIFTACQKEPTACFDASSTNILSGESISFTNCSNDAESYKWNFGDGNTSTSESPSNTYSTSGTYTVTLTALSKNGNKEHQTTMTITVGVGTVELFLGEWDATEYTRNGIDQLGYINDSYIICVLGDTVFFLEEENVYITWTFEDDSVERYEWNESFTIDFGLSDLSCTPVYITNDDIYTENIAWELFDDNSKIRFYEDIIPGWTFMSDTFDVLQLDANILHIKGTETFGLTEVEYKFVNSD
ncbi:MAG: PKD domain-containing protein [Bacteroidetes bacterium]|nr:PKD domain-containing protein [Bacteroidota bacterium]